MTDDRWELCHVILVVVSELIFFFLHINRFLFDKHKFYLIMYIHVFTLGTPCERINCLNGGYCIQPATATTLAYCHCPAQYTGFRCEQAGKKLFLGLFNVKLDDESLEK